jgi:starch phosphorylase
MDDKVTMDPLHAMPTLAGGHRGLGQETPAPLGATLRRHLRYRRGRRPEDASALDLYHALGHSLAERLIDGLLETEARFAASGAKRVHYLSMEFLIGRQLEHNLISLGLYQECRDAVAAMGFSLDAVIGEEPDPALGNGGLGRLAACFLDSMATLGIAGYGYGINYEFGLFAQSFSNGYQQEAPDRWLAGGTPWQIERSDDACIIPLYGRLSDLETEADGRPRWLDPQVIVGMPFDLPVAGYGAGTVNHLRLYAARASNEFDMRIFNAGDYFAAVRAKITSENVTKVLYPDYSIDAGRELRLIQEYFLTACAIRNIVTQHLRTEPDLTNLHQAAAIQLNDTHPALAIVERSETFSAVPASKSSSRLCVHCLVSEACANEPPLSSTALTATISTRNRFTSSTKPSQELLTTRALERMKSPSLA